MARKLRLEDPRVVYHVMSRGDQRELAWLQSFYTIGLNNRHKLSGHVLSGGYQAQWVDDRATGYLRTACDYVHLKPMREKLLAAEDRLLA